MAWNIDNRLSPIHSDSRQYKVPVGADYTVSLDIERPEDYTYRWVEGTRETGYNINTDPGQPPHFTIPGSKLSEPGDTVHYTVAAYVNSVRADPNKLTDNLDRHFYDYTFAVTPSLRPYVNDPPHPLQGRPPDEWQTTDVLSPPKSPGAHTAAEIAADMPWNKNNRLSPIHSDSRQYEVPLGASHTLSLDIERPEDYSYYWTKATEINPHRSITGSSSQHHFTIPASELSESGTAYRLRVTNSELKLDPDGTYSGSISFYLDYVFTVKGISEPVLCTINVAPATDLDFGNVVLGVPNDMHKTVRVSLAGPESRLSMTSSDWTLAGDGSAAVAKSGLTMYSAGGTGAGDFAPLDKSADLGSIAGIRDIHFRIDTMSPGVILKPDVIPESSTGSYSEDIVQSISFQAVC